MHNYFLRGLDMQAGVSRISFAILCRDDGTFGAIECMYIKFEKPFEYYDSVPYTRDCSDRLLIDYTRVIE